MPDDVSASATVVAFSPWFVWSDISGTVTNALVQEIQPGAYSEWGGKIEVYKTMTDWLTGRRELLREPARLPQRHRGRHYPAKSARTRC